MKKNLLILLFFAFIVNARAEFLVEPYVGIPVSGQIESGLLSEEYSGYTIGSRLGWQRSRVFAGLDYRLGRKDYAEKDSGDIEVYEHLFSLVGGYMFPVDLRVWGEYILGGEAESEIGEENTLKTPSGLIVGAGYSGLPYVSLNFEIADYKYDKSRGSNKDIELSHYLLSVSMPFEF